MKETDIDIMKYRKSTHLAGIDVAEIIREKGQCILTIKEAFYDREIDVSGKKLDGYFIEFIEDVKPMMVNSTNRKTIAKVVQDAKGLDVLSARTIKNWNGSKIELYFDSSVIMKGEQTGGIRVRPNNPIPNIPDTNALKILNDSKTKEELKTNWSKLSKAEKSLPTVVELKDKLKVSLK